MQELNTEKYYNSILYFVSNINNVTLGKVKLMKLLYYLDFDHYQLYGSSITGDTYRAMPMGPVPIMGEKILNDMQSKSLIDIQLIDIGYQYPHHRYFAKVPFNIKAFSLTEYEILVDVSKKWAFLTKNEIINATHGEPPWAETELYAMIDYHLASLRIQSLENADEQKEPVQPWTQEQWQAHMNGTNFVNLLTSGSPQSLSLLDEIREGLAQISTGNYTILRPTPEDMQEDT